MSRLRRLSIVAAMLAVLAIVGAFYWQQRRVQEAEDQLGIDASRVLTAVFTSTSALKVSTLRGEILVKSEAGSGWWNWFRNEQRTRAPYTVDYFVDLKGLPASAFRWNGRDRMLSVDLPAVTIGPANIDMSQAQVKQVGTFIGRASAVRMQQIAARRLKSVATRQASKPENIAKANAAARDAVTQFIKAPLSAVGYSDVRVVVRLPGEARPAGMATEQWDRSRSIEEVLGIGR